MLKNDVLEVYTKLYKALIKKPEYQENTKRAIDSMAIIQNVNRWIKNALG